MTSVLHHVVAREGVLLLTMNRPERHHALNFELGSQLALALDKAEKDQEIKVVVLTGSGKTAFCAGQDMVEESNRDQEFNPRVSAYVAIDKFSDSPLPLIAAVNGYCYGGGAALAVSCDIRLASDNATFRFPGAEYGLVVGAAALPRLIGVARAKELILTARKFSAEDAKKWGLVNEIHPQSELLGAALNMAEQIAANSAVAVRESKRIMDQATSNPEARDSENTINQTLRGSQEQVRRFQAATQKVTGR